MHSAVLSFGILFAIFIVIWTNSDIRSLMKMSFHFVFAVTLFVVCVTMPSSTLVRTSVISLKYVDLAIGELEPVQEENPYIRLAASPMVKVKALKSLRIFLRVLCVFYMLPIF